METNDLMEGPLGDADISVMEHLIELRRRLIVFFVPFTIITLIIFPFSDAALHIIYTHLLFSEDVRIAVYSPLEWISLMLLLSFLSAFSITMPLLLYEIFAFLRPGLYPSERQFFLLVVIPSLCLYGLGAFFAYYFVLPPLFGYFIAYSADVAKVAFSAKRIFTTVMYTAVGFGLIFQIPLIMALAVRMKLVHHSWLKEKRMIIYGLIIGITFFIVADPMGISMIMAAISIAMFELGLLITKYIGRKRR
jgi:sec-independent protein translocase protein TatC